MRSLILTVAARVLLPLLIVFALFLLLRGHNAPGGGFAAALVLTAALGIFFLGQPGSDHRHLLHLTPRLLLGLGVLTALAAGIIPLLRAQPFLTANHIPGELPLLGGLHLSTPLLFDIGVCLTSTGALFTILHSLEQRSPWRS